ncbi:MAG TPA: hypothetical protein VJP86_06065 [Vicinamibacterales bacterium]|nr:hypothetical protein [Vicinamibacterales bacterium]
MRQWLARVAPWLLAFSFGFCGTLSAAPQTGWWWNPNESGRGFFVESHDGVTFIGAYLYDSDGHATWYVAGGMNGDSYNYSGALYNMSKGQTLFGSYVPAVGPNIVGTITVHFTDDTHGTVTWPGGTVAIERHLFGSGAAPFQPATGWWWNPSESGSGYSIEVQGNNLFVVGFMYDDAGRAVWYFSAGPMASPTTYHGDVLQFAGGQTMGGPYRAPDPPSTVSTVDIEFSATDDAMLTFTDGTASAASALRDKAARTRTRPIQPQFPKTATYQPPATFSGSFTLNSNTHDTVTLGIVADHQQVTTIDVVWSPLNGRTPVDPQTFYGVDATKSTIRRSITATIVTTAGTCEQTGSITVPFAKLSDPNRLAVSRTQRYVLDVFLDPGTLVTVTQTCVLEGDGTPFTTTFNLPAGEVKFHYEGAVVQDTIAGSGTRTLEEPGFVQTNSYQWRFVGSP